MDPSRTLVALAVEGLWPSFEAKWNLKHMPPAFFRHWVKTTCRRLSDPALAALQGHQPPRDRAIRNTYDTRTSSASSTSNGPSSPMEPWGS